MRFRVRDRLSSLINQNVDPHQEEMVDRARAAIETTQVHKELTERQRAEIQRLVASVRREVAVVRLGRGHPGT